MEIELHSFSSFRIYQPKNGYRFSVEPFLLAKGLKLKAPRQIVDFGSGCGIVAILVAIQNPHCHIYAVESNLEYRQLIGKNIKLNNLNNVSIYDSIDNFVENSIDLFLSNPPYFDSRRFRTSKKFKAEKFDLELTELIKHAKRVLKNKGKLRLVYHPSRFAELCKVLVTNNFGLKSVQPVYGSSKKDACCVLVEAMLASTDHVRFLPPVDLSKESDFLVM